MSLYKLMALLLTNQAILGIIGIKYMSPLRVNVDYIILATMIVVSLPVREQSEPLSGQSSH